MKWLERLLGGGDTALLLSQRYVVIDVETTGLRPYDDRLLAIGAVVVADGAVRLAETFDEVLHQDTPSAIENILVHGIDGTAQTGGRAAAEVLSELVRFAGSSPLVAYHADFDRVFIERAMRPALRTTLPNEWLDLARLAPAFFPEHAGDAQTLDDWCACFGIDNYARHDAVADAFATAQLLQVVLARSAERGLTRYAELVQHERAQRWLER